jgi:hypothetical protein
MASQTAQSHRQTRQNMTDDLRIWRRLVTV